VDMDRSKLLMFATFKDVLPFVVARDAKQHFVQRCEDRTIMLKLDSLWQRCESIDTISFDRCFQDGIVLSIYRLDRRIMRQSNKVGRIINSPRTEMHRQKTFRRWLSSQNFSSRGISNYFSREQKIEDGRLLWYPPVRTRWK
jgi:hypothetical protein